MAGSSKNHVLDWVVFSSSMFVFVVCVYILESPPFVDVSDI